MKPMVSNDLKIVRSRGGTAERTVSVRDIAIPDVPRISVSLISEQRIRGAEQLHADVRKIVDDLCAGRRPSIDMFVPNYWKAVIKLPDNQSAPMLELWHLAHDIGKEVMHTDLNRFRVVREGIEGMQYYANGTKA